MPDERYGNGRVWEGVGPEWVWESGVAVADRAVQVHGGYGYTKDFAVERHYRDARLLELWAPASEDVCDRIAAGLLTEGAPVL